MLRKIKVDQIYLCTQFVDFRKRIPGLAVIVEATLEKSPFDAHLFVFCNKSRNKVRILYWEKNGFCLWEKALTDDRFHWPKKLTDPVYELTEQELQFLLDEYNIQKMKPHKSRNYSTVY
jgi:transposase